MYTQDINKYMIKFHQEQLGKKYLKSLCRRVITKKKKKEKEKGRKQQQKNIRNKKDFTNAKCFS